MQSKIKNVLIPYLVVSIPFLYLKLYHPQLFQAQVPEFTESKFLLCLFYLATGKHMGPMWFIPVLFMLYIFSFLFRLIHKRAWLHYFFLMASILLGVFTFNFGYKFSPFISLLFVMPVYYVGMSYSKWKRKVGDLPRAYIGALSGVIILILLLENLEWIVIDFSYGYAEIERKTWHLINYTKIKMLMIALVYIELLNHLQGFLKRILNSLATYSFGIYFVHLYLLRLGEVALKKTFINFQLNTIYYLLFSAFVLIGSVVVLKLIRLIFRKNSRYLVGC